jgi:hypothetical protein
MKKILFLVAVVLLVAPQIFAASYWVVLKDGTKYEAAGKPVIAGGRATVTLKSGQVIQVASDQIDAAKSEEVTRLGGGSLLGVEQMPVPSQTKASSLGSQIKLRREQQQAQPTTPLPTPAAPVVTGPVLGNEVIEKFERAYENVGVFEHKITSTGAHILRAEMTIDNEDKVFNAISATAFLMVKNAGLSNVTIDEVDMFMKMTNGGTAGRFQMTRADADSLYADGKAPDRTKLQEYFVTKVLF